MILTNNKGNTHETLSHSLRTLFYPKRLPGHTSAASDSKYHHPGSLAPRISPPLIAHSTLPPFGRPGCTAPWLSASFSTLQALWMQQHPGHSSPRHTRNPPWLLAPDRSKFQTKYPQQNAWFYTMADDFDIKGIQINMEKLSTWFSVGSDSNPLSNISIDSTP